MRGDSNNSSSSSCTISSLKVPPASCINNVISPRVVDDVCLRHLVGVKNEMEAQHALLTSMIPEQVLPKARKKSEDRKHSLVNGIDRNTDFADKFESASVMFADIIGFTSYSETVSATKLVQTIGALWSLFDWLSLEHNVCKIKTIGDCYMAVSGIPQPMCGKEHTKLLVNFSESILDALHKFNKEHRTSFQMRIGIASGSVVAGIVGEIGLQYDVWGRTVNLANRIESNGVPGKVCICKQTYDFLQNENEFSKRFKSREPMVFKGFEKAMMTFIVGPVK